MLHSLYRVIVLWFFGGSLVGCAPGLPQPPLLGGPAAFGLGWLVIALIALVVVLMWKREDMPSSIGTRHLTDALNDIHHRLRSLEEKIEKLEKKNNPDKDGGS